MHQLRDYPLAALVPYIDWTPFFIVWDLADYPKILNDEIVGDEAQKSFATGGRCSNASCRRSGYGKRITTCYRHRSDGDDIIVFADGAHTDVAMRTTTLRQR